MTSSPPATSAETLTSEHFDVVWSKAAASRDDAKRVLARADGARAKLVTLLGRERVGEHRFVIRLEGEAKNHEIPTVVPATREILLYRYEGHGGAYEAPLAHELVHAIRVDLWTKPERQTDAGLFWEEAFAELMAREAAYPSLGFPLYGTAPDVAASSLIERGEALPIPKLLANHKALNFRCMAQAYVERISFMAYLRKRFGLAPLVAIAYADQPLDAAHIERVLGARIDDLAAAHDTAVASAKGNAASFRETPIKYIPLCAPTQVD